MRKIDYKNAERAISSLLEKEIILLEKNRRELDSVEIQNWEDDIRCLFIVKKLISEEKERKFAVEVIGLF